MTPAEVSGLAQRLYGVLHDTRINPDEPVHPATQDATADALHGVLMEGGIDALGCYVLSEAIAAYLARWSRWGRHQDLVIEAYMRLNRSAGGYHEGPMMWVPSGATLSPPHLESILAWWLSRETAP